MDISDGIRKPINRQTAEHYVWGGACDGWHLVRRPELSVIEERMSPGASEVRHHHMHARQFFYVLDGKLTLEIEGEEFVLGPGDGLEIQPGQKHEAFNRSASDTRMLVISQPPSHGDRVVSE
jgi:mannose-6-phosphate isomerase-like protein (cupin superfamily)